MCPRSTTTCNRKWNSKSYQASSNKFIKRKFIFNQVINCCLVNSWQAHAYELTAMWIQLHNLYCNTRKKKLINEYRDRIHFRVKVRKRREDWKSRIRHKILGNCFTKYNDNYSRSKQVPRTIVEAGQQLTEVKKVSKKKYNLYGTVVFVNFAITHTWPTVWALKYATEIAELRPNDQWMSSKLEILLFKICEVIRNPTGS